MTRGEFEKMTERYRTGSCTPEEIAFVEKWVEQNRLMGHDPIFFENEADALQLEDEMWNHIQKEVGIIPIKWWKEKWFLRGIAASILLLLSFALLYPPAQVKGPELALEGVETSNTSSTEQRIILPDSSVVTLAQGARILISEKYGQQTRTLHLTGEATFEIRRNTQVPFLVHSGDLVTEVLGTSFVIKPETDKKTIEVSVLTGKVSVYAQEKDGNQRRSGVIITPNQKAVYDIEHKTIRPDLVDQPIMVVQETSAPDFNYDETKIETVLARLQKVYAMEIVVSNPELKEKVFTGNLNGFDLFKQLNYLCDVIDAEYEVRGTTIFLSNKTEKNRTK